MAHHPDEIPFSELPHAQDLIHDIRFFTDGLIVSNAKSTRVPIEKCIWYYAPTFDRARLTDHNASSWITWLTAEMRCRADEDVPMDDLIKWWLTNPEDEPVILIQLPEGCEILDGCHRTAISFAHQLTHIPANVAYLSHPLTGQD
jgi:hypothetical protein